MNSHRKTDVTTNSGKLKSIIVFGLLATPFVWITSEIRNNTFVFHALLLFTGWLSWTYTEYFFHRFIMHEADSSKGLGKLLNHSHHHKDPDDIRVTTPHRILMIVTSIALIFMSIELNNYFTLFCGYFFGFTAFCLMHVVLHHSWSKKIFPQLHYFHIHHHCRHTDKCFGITIPWWDHLFGTIPDKSTVISERILTFYYKRESSKKTFSLNRFIDEKLSLTEKQSA
jgi:sterol desaturase/sphingolipid hydroxylase (fatty acid hydroxylase superfamily)